MYPYRLSPTPTKKCQRQREWEQPEGGKLIDHSDWINRHPFIGEEGICAITEHGHGKFLENREGLLVEVPHHYIAVSSSKQFYDIRITSTRQQSNSAASVERTGANVVWIDSRDKMEDVSMMTEGFSDLGSFHGHLHTP